MLAISGIADSTGRNRGGGGFVGRPIYGTGTDRGIHKVDVKIAIGTYIQHLPYSRGCCYIRFLQLLIRIPNAGRR